MLSPYFRAAGLTLATALFFVCQHTQAVAQDANRDTVYAKTDVGELVQRVAKRSGDFKSEFDRAVAHTMDGPKLEERAKHRADDLHDSAKKLQDVFGDKKDKNNPAVRDKVDKTLAMGSELSTVMKEHRFTDKLQQDWSLLRSDLNALATIYGLSPM
jgi:hypothetical protein